jgi:hypothetical protein
MMRGNPSAFEGISHSELFEISSFPSHLRAERGLSDGTVPSNPGPREIPA